ncbi:MAG: hypothetical protein ACRDRK_13525 [Pseudonocardia sp.]
MTQTAAELADLFEGPVERIPDALRAQGVSVREPHGMRLCVPVRRSRSWGVTRTAMNLYGAARSEQ